MLQTSGFTTIFPAKYHELIQISMKCYFNGEIIPVSDARIGLDDLALVRGFGIFDFFIFERFQPRFLDEYLDRFFRSANYLGLQSPASKGELRLAIHELIAANEQADGCIRLVLTGGYAKDGFTPGKGNLFVLQMAMYGPPTEQYEHGAKLATYQHQRELPNVKSINYLSGIYLLPWLKERDAHYVLYHDGKYLRESDRSNFFMVTQDDVLVTPKEKILEGITRKKVLEQALKAGRKVEVREVLLTELKDAKEAFLTNTTKGALPVCMIDGQAVGNGKPGPVAKAMQEAYSALISVEQLC